MTGIKRNVIVLSLAVAALACGLLLANSLNKKANAATAEFPENVIKDTYYLNQELTLPDSVKVVYKENEYELNEKALVYPDGAAYDKDIFTLNLYGDYKAVYTLKNKDLIIKSEKTFSVIDKNFGVSSEYSSAEYGELTEEFAKGAGKTGGIKVSLASGDTFNYNVPININKKSATDFVTLYTPQTPNAADAGNIYVRLTDCYDSSIYVDFLLWYDAGQSVHARAGGSGQVLSGLNTNPRVSDTGTPVYINGEEWYVATTRFGRILGHSSTGTAPSGFTWRYNSQTKEVSINNRAGDFVTVTQLANTDIYGTNTFGGFTTGEVYLSVYAEDYNESAVRIEIAQIDGASEEGLVSADYKDEIAPVITIDERVPENGVVYVAKGETVEIFNAIATDVSNAKITSAVYYNYESSKRSSVFVKDGKFVAERPGAYTIVYTATDYFGNSASEKITVNCVETENGKAIDFSVAKADGLRAGYETELPAYSAKGLNGEVTVDVYATSGGEKTQIINNKFIPTKVGTYEISYSYYDDISAYEYSYSVECVASDAVRIPSDIYLPRYFIKDAEYSLDDVKADIFTGKAGDYADTEFFVKYDDGEYVKADVHSFKISGNETVRVKYVCGNETVESLPIEIIDVGFNSTFDMSAYFQGDFVADSNSNRIRYTSNASSGNNELRFINALSLGNFRLEFTVPTGAYYKSLTVKLIDCYDADNAITVKFYSTLGAIGATVNGVDYKSTGNFADGSIKSLYYDNASKKLVLPGGTAVPIKSQFKTDLVFLDVVLEDISGEAYVEFTTVNNQPFSTTYFDIIEPIISFTDRSGRYDLGDKIVLDPALYTDVISPSLYGKLTIEVLDPSENYVVSDEGVTLDGSTLANEKYTVTLSSYGNYRINYKTVDQSGNETSLPCVINVEDDVKPVVTIKEEVVKVKALTVTKIDNFTVSDNLTATENLKVTIIVMDVKQNSVVFVGEEFAARYVGTYKVYVYCADEVGNESFASFTLIVE